ncbi:MAG TPA: M23 family metallopeptidase [Candidatus Eisenbacteria bacterium]|nr:M23 family metallopeptidase [Candidatus Eisenbacteria bacterium]
MPVTVRLLLPILATLAASVPAAAAAVVAPLVVRAVAPVDPVQGADARLHLAYELLIMNFASSQVSLDTVEALDAATETVVARMQGPDLGGMLRLAGGAGGTAIGAGASATLFMDVSLPAGARAPRALSHRFAITVAPGATPPPEPGDRDPSPPAAKAITFVGAPVGVAQRRAVVLSSPLRGPRWLVANGCCTPITAHRGATLPIDGTIRVAERFAIDFVQLAGDGRLFTGDKSQLSSYAFYGVEVLSVARGIVVETENALPEQVPATRPPDATISNAAGNHVIVDIGDGRFALYAHLQPGSVRVRKGDHVRRGQPLGLLGNSGNTDAPHLHFHVMDAPSPLVANGLPYVLASFTGEGRLTNEDALWNGEPATIDRGALAGAHADQLPLDDEIVAFP